MNRREIPLFTGRAKFAHRGYGIHAMQWIFRAGDFEIQTLQHRERNGTDRSTGRLPAGSW
jgi:hypothetical protein